MLGAPTRPGSEFSWIHAVFTGSPHALPTWAAFVIVSLILSAQREAMATAKLLEQAKSNLDLAVGAAQVAIWNWDTDAQSGMVSGSSEAVLGIPSATKIDETALARFVAPTDIRFLVKSLQRAATNGGRAEVKFRTFEPSGQVKWVHCISAAENLNSKSLNGIFLDVPERKNAEVQLEMARVEVGEAQLRSLRYQVNPHFLFNTLSSIATLIIDGEPTQAEEMVLKLAAFYRSSLQRDPLQKITLRDEIALQKLYLSIEKVRFPDELEVTFDIPQDWKTLWFRRSCCNR